MYCSDSEHKEFNSRAKGVHVCVDDDEDEGDDEVEDQPDIHHLDVSGHWQVRVHLEFCFVNAFRKSYLFKRDLNFIFKGHLDEEGNENQHRSKIYGYHRLKIRILKHLLKTFKLFT